MSLFAQDETASKEKHFGVSISSNYLSGLGTIPIGSSVFYFQNNHQFELGFGYHLAEMSFQRKFGGEFHYKYFKNGIDNRFNVFYLASASVTRNYRHRSMFSGDIRRKELDLGLLAGFGCQVKLSDRMFIGASLSAGVSTYSIDAVNDHYSREMFQYYNFERAVRINIGYRFR